MRKIINLVILLFVATFSYAQTLTTTENYFYTKNCLNEDCSKKSEVVEYSDQLGRVKQIINIKASPLGRDIVVPVEYDGFGRNVKSYLPIPQVGTTDGTIYSDPKGNASQTYGTDVYYFSSVQPESSPKNRILSQKKPGADYSAYSTNFTYDVNTASDVKKFSVTTSWENGATSEELTLNGNYGAGMLTKTSVTDEDGKISIEFKNGKGQTLLVRTIAVQNADTYYVYNKFGQLAYIIPPIAVSKPLNQNTLDSFCYQYRYDTRNRQVEKKLPGKGWEYAVYDKLNRVIMSQDANIGKTKKWLFTKFDNFGRTLYTGMFTSSQDYGSVGRQYEQNQASNANSFSETYNNTGFNASGLTTYYTNTAYPTTFSSILSVNYYNIYPQGSPAKPIQILGADTISDDMSQSLNTKNLPTATFVKNIEDDRWTKNYLWYDKKSRNIGIFSENYLGGYTKTEMNLDFTGLPLQTVVYHKRLVSDTEKRIIQTYEYDSRNRLRKHYHQIDNQPQVLLSENTFTELSQVSNKKVGNNLQNIDYKYDIRGSLLAINDPSQNTGKLFSLALSYYKPVSNASGKKSGNVEETLWKSSKDNILKKYVYSYDDLNRLNFSTYTELGVAIPKDHFYDESVTYDLGGNIISLQRNGQGFTGTAQQIDDLIYNYTGNRLVSIADSSNNYAGYPVPAGQIISYDDNGNIVSHMDKGIKEIGYNFLNLPNSVKFNSTYVPRPPVLSGNYYVNTSYLYNASGIKLRKSYTYGAGKANIESTLITDYLDGFQYETLYTGGLADAVLKFVSTAEGYFDYEKNIYIYNYKDQLGNIRLSYFRNSIGNAEILNENNFYPYGLKTEYNQDSSYKYEYSGKEIQVETGWNDFGARMYMADIGRWGVMDPLTELLPGLSPYNFANNNPMMFIDPTGMLSQAFMNEILASPDGTTWTNTGTGFTNNWGGTMSYNGTATNYSGYGFASSGGGSGGMGGSPGFQVVGTIGGIPLYAPIPEIKIPEVVLKYSANWGERLQEHFNQTMALYNIIGLFGGLGGNSSGYNTYFNALDGGGDIQAKMSFAIGSTYGVAGNVSQSLISRGKMISSTNIFTTYNLYRTNGYLNGNRYISGVRFLNNVRTINRINDSRLVKGVGILGVGIYGAQFIESHHPGYITKAVASFYAGRIPYFGSSIALSIDLSNVDYWNIWTLNAAINGSHEYDYLHP